MFNNDDINRCPPVAVGLFDMAGEQISADLAKIVKISTETYNRDKIVVIPKEFVTGT